MSLIGYFYYRKSLPEVVLHLDSTQSAVVLLYSGSVQEPHNVADHMKLKCSA